VWLSIWFKTWYDKEQETTLIQMKNEATLTDELQILSFREKVQTFIAGHEKKRKYFLFAFYVSLGLEIVLDISLTCLYAYHEHKTPEYAFYIFVGYLSLLQAAIIVFVLCLILATFNGLRKVLSKNPHIVISKWQVRLNIITICFMLLIYLHDSTTYLVATFQDKI
jgi:hypothetical protein